MNIHIAGVQSPHLLSLPGNLSFLVNRFSFSYVLARSFVLLILLRFHNKMDHVKNLWSSYLQWVAEHPQLATDIETSIKWISYIATGMYLKPAIKSTYLIDVRYVHMWFLTRTVYNF